MEQNKYIGKRYVPKIMGQWDKNTPYEGLSIVQQNGNSFTSKQDVPVGTDLFNTEYWVSTGNYDIQIEQYRQDVLENNQNLENFKESTNEQLEHITPLFINATSYNGIVIDETDWSISINTAINKASEQGGGKVIVPPGSYNTRQSIIVKPFVELVIESGATIFVTENIDGIIVNKNGKVTGKGRIDTTKAGETYSKSALIINGSEKIFHDETFLGGLYLNGLIGSGKGLHLYCDPTVSSHIAWVRIHDLVISGFNYGIHLNVARPTDESGFYNFINGNLFSNIVISNSVYGIKFDGSSAEPNSIRGNTFTNVEIGPWQLTKALLSIKGANNVFTNLYLFDAQVIESGITIELLEESFQNSIQYSQLEGTVVDKGRQNFYENGSTRHKSININSTNDTQYMVRLNDLGKLSVYKRSGGPDVSNSIRKITNTSGHKTLSIYDETLLVNSSSYPVNVTLPKADTVTGIVYTIKKMDTSSYTVTIKEVDNQLIDGVESLLLNVQFDSITVQSTGSQWIVL